MSNAPTGIADYIGRTIDLVAYHGVQSGGEQLLQESLSEPGQGGSIVTGVQKVVQRFLTELLKERGSMTFRPAEGTLFLTEARIGRFQTQADVEGAFARAVLDVGATIRAQESETDPDDERFVGANILSVIVSPGTAVIRFELETRAGADRKFIFPLQIPL